MQSVFCGQRGASFRVRRFTAAWSIDDGNHAVAASSEVEERPFSKRRPKFPTISQSKASVFSRHEGVAVAAIAAWSGVEKPLISVAKIVK
jgi:hypothetical protein